jgi:hypothetical protein
MKMESFVMPAWIAGIQVRRMRPETSMSAWIPALHAGMTESRGSEIFDHNLRALRVLRGDLLFSFGCGFAALGSVLPFCTLSSDEGLCQTEI